MLLSLCLCVSCILCTLPGGRKEGGGQRSGGGRFRLMLYQYRLSAMITTNANFLTIRATWSCFPNCRVCHRFNSITRCCLISGCLLHCIIIIAQYELSERGQWVGTKDKQPVTWLQQPEVALLGNVRIETLIHTARFPPPHLWQLFIILMWKRPICTRWPLGSFWWTWTVEPFWKSQ